MRYYLAVDIGASSGRHMLGHLENGRLVLEELHRFPNCTENNGGRLCWNTEALFSEIISGLKKCADTGKTPVSAGIDTWGVDFVLLDRDGGVLGNTVAYRDSRTNGRDTDVYEHISERELYERTGIAKQIFNTVYQLMAVKSDTPSFFEHAVHLLLMPDYLHWKLCGVMKTEYTNATTTGLVNALSKEWDTDIIDRLGYPRRIFQEIAPPGTKLGKLTESVKNAVGFDCGVVLPPTHDTASAFLAVPADSDKRVYISSGTWSLMGVELPKPVTSEESRAANFTNEGGYICSFRYLKNIMGLWMIQSVRRENGGADFAELSEMAENSDFEGVVDVNSSVFLAPDSMTEAVKKESGAKSLPDILKCIYSSLALSYAKTVRELERLSGRRFDGINITGGGSRDAYLNKLTAKACGLPVYAGPVECTALGNIVSQMIADGGLKSVADARKVIRQSFEIKEILP